MQYDLLDIYKSLIFCFYILFVYVSFSMLIAMAGIASM